MTPDRAGSGNGGEAPLSGELHTVWYHSISNRLILLLLAVVAALATATGILLWRALATTVGLPADTDLAGAAAAVAGQDQAAVTAILRSTLVNLAVVVAVTLLAAAAFSRALLVDPIARLTQASRALAAGDLSARVDLADRSELGELARSFDAMAESLARSKEDLEARVVTRTTELRSLLSLSNTIALTTDLRPQIDAVLDQLVTGGRVAAAEILELEPTGKLVRLARLGADPGARAGGGAEDARPEGFDATLAGLAPHAVVDGDELALPLRARDRVVGVLVASTPTGAGWDEERLRWVGGLAAQAAVALENNRLYELARDEAAEEERRHLARELHDSVSQAIYSVVLTAHAAEKRLGTDPDAVGKALAGVIELSEAALAEMRALIFELRPEALAEVGLVGALHRQLDGMELRHGLRAVRRLDQEPDLPFTTKQVLLRVAQEALHNVVKHAAATSVTVRASVAEAAPDGPLLRLEVADDGVGFDTSLAYPGHLGLTSMHERVAALGGTLRIESASQAGTTVTVELPLSPRAGSEA
ncbi:MAG: HAMP domain-containing protein [Trueperaceae bacterium]|nr:HAMP domain-containing protein [Trueperaceae bacterium]MCC6310235.1 HAMP domain-containing protein [Trueperaceae bacterium]MCO5173235.1 histidine kinase [Trueperaceae bacterium]MCW5818684.1 HAMP domain-containing protein [Trueperaceae bacterium]